MRADMALGAYHYRPCMHMHGPAALSHTLEGIDARGEMLILSPFRMLLIGCLFDKGTGYDLRLGRRKCSQMVHVLLNVSSVDT